MINKKFEAYKVKRELKRSGLQYTFIRINRNEFKEPMGGESEIGNLLGIYHEENSNIQINTGDAIQTRTKKIPMILCLYEQAISLNLKNGDYVYINGRKYNFTGIVNISEWNLIADISLELVDDGDKD